MGRYRMFYFAQRHEEGREANAVAQAMSAPGTTVPYEWEKLGLLSYRNPEAIPGDAHRPWILMDPHRPNVAVRVANRYWLFVVTWHGASKRIQVATAETLAGPWSVRAGPVLDLGGSGAFDQYHTDTVTAYWFSDRETMLLFYKGYPASPQADQPHSPFGSSSAAAVMQSGDAQARKLGKVLGPNTDPQHWLAGWVGGLQIFPAEAGGWYGLLNGSPTPPDPVDVEPEMREPAPSQGGWAYTPDSWPVSGWVPRDQPIERVGDIPAKALAWGEGVSPTTSNWSPRRTRSPRW